LYDAAVLISPSGITGVYKKLHLFRPYHEDKIFKYGDRLGLFDTSIGKIGIAICYDLRFPELFRVMGKGGARIIFVPASWGAPRAIQWRALLRARAAENEVFVAGVNRVGKSGVTHEEYGGDSSVFDPFGYEVVHSEGGEQILTTEIDLRRIEVVRRQLPLWEDRRIDKYGIHSSWGFSD
jgi:omega-amidase